MGALAWLEYNAGTAGTFMIRRQTSIQGKLTSAIMGTSITVLLLTGIGFLSYEWIAFTPDSSPIYSV